ncbi:MAG: hypothetical protein QN183_04155 [Armatimonadota bacterium]|nr:hypothetical protein [Armatimonadota bacterium]MDR7534487.1 hypothetical protein [Armatimonadota bacterium]MDR7535545.1 hypothetical protein [Armatimonadota bacterium]
MTDERHQENRAAATPAAAGRLGTRVGRGSRALIAALAAAVAVVGWPAIAQLPVAVEAWRGVPERVRALFEDAVKTALPIMETEGLGLAGQTVRYVLFPDQTALLEGYQTLLGYSRERAEALVWSTGRAIRDRTGNYVFTRLDRFGPGGPDRIVAVRHVSHELTHIVQGAVKLCPGAVPSWVTEGWAEWAGFRTVDLAQLRPYAAQRAERLEVIRRTYQRTVIPTLVQLDRQEWARLVQARGSPATYGVALLAVERLIERTGGPQALDAYCTAARVDGRWAAFERVFGISEPDYALEFLRFLQGVLNP